MSNQPSCRNITFYWNFEGTPNADAPVTLRKPHISLKRQSRSPHPTILGVGKTPVHPGYDQRTVNTLRCCQSSFKWFLKEHEPNQFINPCSLILISIPLIDWHLAPIHRCTCTYIISGTNRHKKKSKQLVEESKEIWSEKRQWLLRTKFLFRFRGFMDIRGSI